MEREKNNSCAADSGIGIELAKVISIERKKFNSVIISVPCLCGGIYVEYYNSFDDKHDYESYIETGVIIEMPINPDYPDMEQNLQYTSTYKISEDNADVTGQSYFFQRKDSWEKFLKDNLKESNDDGNYMYKLFKNFDKSIRDLLSHKNLLKK